METVLFENVKKLFDQELYDSVIPTASLLSTLYQNDRSATTPELEYQVLLFHGNACYHEKQYRSSFKFLESALLMRKSMARYKSAYLATMEANYPQFIETEIRYRIAVCHRELGDHNTAMATLQSMPIGSRSPKMNMMLSKLLNQGRSSNTSDAILVYKEVLRECPMALCAIEALLELGVDGTEVNTLVMNASNVAKNIEWLVNWIKAHAQMYGRKHMEAAKTFQALNDNTKFRQNEFLLTMIGKCLYYYGSSAQAQHYLETAAMINQNNMEAVMPLTVVYEYNQKVQDLEKLAAKYTNINEFTSAHWFVLGQSFYATGKLEKASSFTHKAISVDQRNFEAQLLRGKICLQLKRPKDAILFFRNAQCIASYRFEVYKGLFHCYVGLKRLKEAQTMCSLAVRYFRHSPRSLVMFARTLFHSTNPTIKKSAKKFAQKAMNIDENYAPAVSLMAEIYQAEGDTQKAITMLNKQVSHHPHHKLFTMLGDILSAEKDFSGALEYYTIALNMEPTYQRALEGVNALGRATRETKQEQDVPMTTSNAQDEEWPIDYDEPSMEAAEVSSPAVANDDAESDTFSDLFWQDVDGELTN